MTMMHGFLAALRGGLARAAQLRLALPLYMAGLLIGLAQAWPAPLVAREGPLLDLLAGGELDALTYLLAGDSGASAPQLLLWVALALLGALLLAGLYNFFSGGILSVWAGGPFWAGCRRFFWCFVAIGSLLVILLVLAMVAVGFVAAAAGFTAAAAVGLVLVQLIGLLGEYARAAAIAADRANPIAALAAGGRQIVRRPLGILALAALGVLLHASISAAYNALGGHAGWGAPVLQQAAAFGWVWVKLLRLGWAAAYMGQ
jgi:hypothetical protein